jgi:hypothetical protein
MRVLPLNRVDLDVEEGGASPAVNNAVDEPSSIGVIMCDVDHIPSRPNQWVFRFFNTLPGRPARELNPGRE